jgi:hypothetical protein
MILETKPLVEITRDAIQVLSKEIGIVNTIRFLTQFTAGYGNYTQEREQLFAEKGLEAIMQEIKQRKRDDA